MNHRRKFIQQSAYAALAASMSPILSSCSQAKSATSDLNSKSAISGKEDMFFKISLAQWSFNKALFAGDLMHLDFAAKTRSLDMDGMEYVNRFFMDKAEDQPYLKQMNVRARDAGVKQLLIMVDGEGGLGTLDDVERKVAVEKHYKWVDAAKTLGCHSIRVNAFGEGSEKDVHDAAIQGLGALSEYAATEGLNVIVENHGSYSSDGSWLASVMKQVGMSNCGTLPDFGNFCMKREGGVLYGAKCIEEYDRYQGVTDMMPYAKAVSAKANDFNSDGDEIHTDFYKMMKIVQNHGYNGYVGIEYEGSDLSEEAGIIKTRDLLRKVGAQLS